MVVAQGDVFWTDLGAPFGSEPGKRRPVVVVQSDLFNRTRINTVVVVALTTRLRLGDLPGNVTLQRGEANLPRRSVANVTQIATVDRARLGEKVGRLSQERVAALLEGLDLLLRGSA